MREEISEELRAIKVIIASLQVGKRYYKLEEAADYLGISKSTLYKHTSAGNIPYYKPNGKLVIFSKEDLDNWLLKTRIPSNEELKNRA